MKKYRQNDTFHFENDPYAKNAQDIGKIMHELIFFKFYRQSVRIKVRRKIILICFLL